MSHYCDFPKANTIGCSPDFYQEKTLICDQETMKKRGLGSKGENQPVRGKARRLFGAAAVSRSRLRADVPGGIPLEILRVA
jgi:hypothetical protein